jgi:hypothetical protein
MAAARTASSRNPWVHGTGRPVVNFTTSTTSTRRLAIASSTKPDQTQSFGNLWIRQQQQEELSSHTEPERSRSPLSPLPPDSDGRTRPAAIQDAEAPSHLAASHRNIRPQLSQALRRLYGTTQHRGILAGLAILKLYCECLGTTWTGNPARDPTVFFRTADMANTSKWQRLPAEFEKNQAKAYSFAPPNHSAGCVSDRSSGLGPVPGRPPYCRLIS